jgi:hypothetical protein
MNRVLKLFRGFPEWSSLEASLQKMTTQTAKSIQFYDIAHGEKFTEFSRRTPSAVGDVLSEIENTLKPMKTALSSSVDSLTTLRKDLSVLKSMHSAIVKQRKDAERAVQQWEKSHSAESAAQRKLEQVRQQALDVSAVAKLEDRFSVAHRLCEHDLEQKTRKTEELAAQEESYQEQLFRCILDALNKYATAKCEIAQALVPVGKEVARLAARMPSPEEGAVAEIQTEIQSIEAEIGVLETEQIELSGDDGGDRAEVV